MGSYYTSINRALAGKLIKAKENTFRVPGAFIILSFPLNLPYHHLQLPICMNTAKSDFDGDPITIFILACFALGRHLLSLPDVGHVGGRALVTGQGLGLTWLAWRAVAGMLFPMDPVQVPMELSFPEAIPALLTTPDFGTVLGASTGIESAFDFVYSLCSSKLSRASWK